jgi:hypothetical protein
MSTLQELSKLKEPPKLEHPLKLKDWPKTIDRLLNLYSHQNTLLWSRLQTLTALQIPVLGGWYFFLSKATKRIGGPLGWPLGSLF